MGRRRLYQLISPVCVRFNNICVTQEARWAWTTPRCASASSGGLSRTTRCSRTLHCRAAHYVRVLVSARSGVSPPAPPKPETQDRRRGETRNPRSVAGRNPKPKVRAAAKPETQHQISLRRPFYTPYLPFSLPQHLFLRSDTFSFLPPLFFPSSAQAETEREARAPYGTLIP